MSCTPCACILRLMSLPIANVDSGTLTVNGYRNKSLPSHHSVSVHRALMPIHHPAMSMWLSVTVHSPCVSSSTYTVRSISHPSCFRPITSTNLNVLNCAGSPKSYFLV